MAFHHFTLVTHVVRRGDGQGRVNLEVVREALKQDLSVTIVASEIAPELELDRKVIWKRIRVKGIPSFLLRERVFAMRSAIALRRHQNGPLLSNGCITTIPADINACHFVHSSWLNSPVHTAKLTGGIKGAYQKAYSKINARLEKIAYREASKVVSVSEQVRRELIAIGIDPNKIVTVPNGVDTDEFVPGKEDRKRFGLPENVPLALFAGDIRSPRKNLDTVLKALVDAPQLHLAVAGGLESSPFPALANELGLADRVHFLDSVRDMPNLMRSCDAFAFPSRYEACSLVMLEAMASGLPIITSRTTGGAELVPEDGGFLMDNPDDKSTLVSILQRVVDDPKGLRARSEKARERSLELRWDTMGRKYLELLQAAATGPTR